jgi:hypothetical protein
MTITAVQTTVYDASGAYYPGQIADLAGNLSDNAVKTYRTETVLVMGRGVVKGTNNTQDSGLLTPFGVKTPLAGSVTADFVGIAVLTPGNLQNVDNNATTIRATTLHPIAELGSKLRVAVKANAAVAHGDAVYMSVSHATIPVGEFTNASGTGLIAITGATWYGAAASGTVGRIQL